MFLNLLTDFELDRYSFLIGFAAATVFWWLVIRLRPYVKQAFDNLKESIQTARESMQT